MPAANKACRPLANTSVIYVDNVEDNSSTSVTHEGNVLEAPPPGTKGHPRAEFFNTWSEEQLSNWLCRSALLRTSSFPQYFHSGLQATCDCRRGSALQRGAESFKDSCGLKKCGEAHKFAASTDTEAVTGKSTDQPAISGSVFLDPLQTSLFAAKSDLLNVHTDCRLHGSDAQSVVSPAEESDHATARGGVALAAQFALELRLCYRAEDELTNSLRRSEYISGRDYDEVVGQEACCRGSGSPGAAVVTMSINNGGISLLGTSAQHTNLINPLAFSCDAMKPGSRTNTKDRLASPSRCGTNAAYESAAGGSIGKLDRSSIGPADQAFAQQCRHVATIRDKQRVDQSEAEDRKRDAQRHREHPLLVEDALRYAALLVLLQASETMDLSALTPPTNDSGAQRGAPLGEPSRMLYLKYPPPLFRSTSFTAETLRLLRWLHTWKKDSSATDVSSASASVMPPVASAIEGEDGRRMKKAARGGAETPQGSWMPFFGAAAVRNGKGKGESSTSQSGVKRGRGTETATDAGDGAPQERLYRVEGQGGLTDTESQAPSSSFALASVSAEYYSSWRWMMDAPNDSSASSRWVESLPQGPTAPHACLSVGPGSILSTSPVSNLTVAFPPAPSAAASSDDKSEVEELGSTSTVYYDAFGNRLRSARLAKKDAVRRLQEEEEQRQRAKKRGYFLRTGSTSAGDSNQQDTGWRLSLHRGRCSDGKSDYGSGRRPRRYSSSEDDDDSLDDLTNIAVVCGPTGSGKTAAVYLAAAALGFRVIEMNASTRRTPQNVERLLAELTQSHRLSGLHQGKPRLSVENELEKLKKEHAALAAQLQAEAEAAAREEATKRKSLKKANAISAAAVAAFFRTRNTAPEEADTAALSTPVVEPKPSPRVEEIEVDTISHDERETHCVDSSDEGARLAPCRSPHGSPPDGRAFPPCTLLLIEDADVQLGDESMKGIYAAIRDLAMKSKVPIVVTVSSPPSSAHRYDSADSPIAAGTGCLSKQPGCKVTSSVARCTPAHDRQEEMEEQQQRLWPEAPQLSGDSNTCTSLTFSPQLAAQYFGRQTPFTALDPLPRPALFVQLLVISAVELGLIARSPGPHHCHTCVDRDTAAMDSIVGQQRISSQVTQGVLGNKHAPLRDGKVQAAPRSTETGSCKGKSLAHVEGAVRGESATASSCPTKQGKGLQYFDQVVDGELCITDTRKFSQLAHFLRTELYGEELINTGDDAGIQQLTRRRVIATDIRHWLNRLQFLMLQPLPQTVGSERSPRGGDDCSHVTAPLVNTCHEVSEWDVRQGRYISCLNYNDEHCPRQQMWEAKSFLDYEDDIQDELQHLDHPTRSCGHTTSSEAGARLDERKQSVGADDPCSRQAICPLFTNGTASRQLCRSPTSLNATCEMNAGSGMPHTTGLQRPVAFQPSIRDVAEVFSPRLAWLLLPYGELQRHHEHQLRARSVRDAMLGSIVPQRPITAAVAGGSQPPVVSAAKKLLADGGSESTVAERIESFKSLWRRPRKREAVRQLVAGRDPRAYEDVIGFGHLISSSSP